MRTNLLFLTLLSLLTAQQALAQPPQAAATETAAPAAARHTGPWDMETIVNSDRLLPIHVWNSEVKTGINTCYIGFPNTRYKNRESWYLAYLAHPDRPQTPLPAMILVHGGGGRAFPEWAEQWARRGYYALAIDFGGLAHDGRPWDEGGPPQDDEAKFYAIDRGPLTDTWPYQAVHAILRAHSMLAKQKDVDSSRIGITGISWGGYLTCLAAGIDDRFRVAVPVYGCGYLGDNSHWKDAGTFDRLSPAGRKLWLETFDPSQYLAGISCPTLFVNGTNDFAYPMDSHQRSYDLVQSPKKLCVTVNMPHSHEDGWAPPEIAAFIDSILKDGPPLATLEPLTLADDQVTTTYADAEIQSAALHFTSDTGPWQQRRWVTIPAVIHTDTHTLSAPLPTARPLVCFMTTRDQRELTVSTPYIALPAPSPSKE